MDHIERSAAEDPETGAAVSRRALFGRGALVATGAAAALFGLTGCPGGDDDDDDDGGEDDD